MLPLFALILGTADFGFMIFRWTTLQNAVREGVRYAVTFQVDSSGHQDTSIEDQVQTFAMGFVKTADNPQTIYVKYYNPVHSHSSGEWRQCSRKFGNGFGSKQAFAWLTPLSGTFRRDPPPD